MRAGWKTAAIAGLGLWASGCKGLDMSKVAGGVDTVMGTTAATKQQREACKKFNVEPTVTEEYAIGSAMAIHWVQGGGGLMPAADTAQAAATVHGIHQYLNVVGKNLAAQSARPTLEWTFGIINDREHFNAVSSPGGYVFVTRRMLADLDNEAQLAGVLAHEIAHVVLKHSIQQYNAAKVDLCQATVTAEGFIPGSGQFIVTGGSSGNLDLDGDPALLGNLAEKALGIFEKGNDHAQEFAADQMAVKLMMSAGYDPAEYRALLAKTQDSSSIGSRHPKKAERVKRITAFLGTVKDASGEFSELSLEGLSSPPLAPALVAAVRGPGSGVAKDGR
ncbi:M48 family metallopeptidase [Myxococcus sp. K15C18031901]|uniref:M48 family metallopeptidase n=1 Tax=Myxococcus dinghuensis TaxID=2906761 RepID=UPI0020A7C42A|nr:M48 family metallopeptidase [Myxococcus dinghuensis]MCP3100998.1 M48 family metallopeptidase [Myxococcus dinghuensis]